MLLRVNIVCSKIMKLSNIINKSTTIYKYRHTIYIYIYVANKVLINLFTINNYLIIFDLYLQVQ